MNFETRVCQNCEQQFTIEPEDFDFYAKIQVPPPTFCPECRLQRRFCFRNERSLYKRKCDLCQTDIVAMYGPDAGFPVHCHECWWSDKWEAASFGMDCDFSRPFFDQYAELFKKVPQINFWQRNNDANCLYSNFTAESKGTYLSYSIVNSEGIYYSRAIDSSLAVYDCLNADKLNSCYGGVYFGQCNNSHFLLRSANCIDSWFLFDCVNCQDCVLSANLRHKRYVIKIIQYSKEEYFKKLAEFDFGSYAKLESYKKDFDEIINRAIHRYADMFACTNSTGDALANSKNAKNCFEGWELENIKNLVRGYYLKDCQDVSLTIYSQRLYEYISGGRDDADLKFCLGALSNFHDASYSSFCGSSSNLFGCVGLRNKSYCILNKQYSKEEYEALVPRIIQHMNNVPYVTRGANPSTGSTSSPQANSGQDSEAQIVYRYGEFFPPELSPFAYNETVAQEYFPLTKERTLGRGFRWKDPDTRLYNITKMPEDLPDHIKGVDDTILKEIIGCAHSSIYKSLTSIDCGEQCTQAFKIVSQELEFYRRINLPLPRLCPNCRHYARLKQKNLPKLWHRSCLCESTSHSHTGKCPNEFATSYQPEGPEIVYCEVCYNAEVI